jgi:probable HAF family extracellular repeat protein
MDAFRPGAVGLTVGEERRTATVPPVPGDITTPVPPAVRRRRRRLAFALIALGALVLVVPLVLLAVSGRSGDPSGLAPVSPTAEPSSTPSETGSATPSSTPSATAATRPPSGSGLPSRYVPVSLGGLGGSPAATVATSMNHRGQVVGQAETATGARHPFLWQDGRMTDLGLLEPGPGGWTQATDINNNGDVVGCGELNGTTRAVLWRRGETIELGSLGSGYSCANAINDRGQVVGNSSTSNGDLHAFVWENGTMRDLGVAGGTVVAEDINNEGQILGGWAEVAGAGSFEPFLWDHGSVVWLRTPTGLAYAKAINSRGEAIGGYVVVHETNRAVRWYRGAATVLPILPGGNFAVAAAINDSGMILGSSDVGPGPHPGKTYAVIWWRGAIHKLDRAGISGDTELVALNNRGQILARNTLYNPVRG